MLAILKLFVMILFVVLFFSALCGVVVFISDIKRFKLDTQMNLKRAVIIMLYDVQNSCYQLLKLLGCDLSAIDTITTWKQFGVLCIEFIFACIMLYLLWKMLYNAMIRFFNPRRW